MTAIAKDASIYILNDESAKTESDRLDDQHEICNEIMRGELLPPHIRDELLKTTSRPKVVDVATGSSAWLRAMAKTLPDDAELVGLDYDPSKFPPAASLPSNMTLREADMYRSFDEDLIGRFDVVHVRLINLALKAGQGVQVLQNLMTLLRPGGWVVWTETTPALIAAEPPSLAWFKVQELFWLYQQSVGAEPDVPVGLPMFLQQAGYGECGDRAYTGSSPLYTGKGAEWKERIYKNTETFASRMLKGVVDAGGLAGMKTQADADALCNEFKADFAGGQRKLHHIMVRAWGKKP
ncbi:S-adenosyl-L-methionine-dependent methyltransferase [Poronia punctata]|nr:S-adenosyl-L-methionine-dependent methyltransferase [Poronia punctata]